MVSFLALGVRPFTLKTTGIYSLDINSFCSSYFQALATIKRNLLADQQEAFVCILGCNLGPLLWPSGVEKGNLTHVLTIVINAMDFTKMYIWSHSQLALFFAAAEKSTVFEDNYTIKNYSWLTSDKPETLFYQLHHKSLRHKLIKIS